VNENPPPSIFTMTGAAWFAHKRSNAGPAVLTAVEFLMINYNGAPTVTLDVGIWDEDPLTGAPRNLLGSGTFTVPQNVPGYWGARLATPASLPSAGNYFAAVRTPNAIAAFSRSGASPTPYWFSGSGGWTSVNPIFGLSFRVYAGTHSGSAAAFGAGQGGSGAVVPQIAAAGWPNTGNRIGVRMHGGLGGAPSMFLFGSRAALVLPFGTVHALPQVILPVTARGLGVGAGYAEVDLVVPNEPTLAGQRLAAQVFLMDPGAWSGLSHTGGLELTIGH
jgi:hypothetical protein